MIIRVETKLTLRVGEHYVHQTHAVEMDHKDVVAILFDDHDLGDKAMDSFVVHLDSIREAYTLAAQVVSESVWDAIIDNIEELEGDADGR